MVRAGLVVMLVAACSDPAAVLDAGVDAELDAHVELLAVSPVGHDFGPYAIGSGAAPIRFPFEIGTTGAVAVDVTAIEITGAAAADYMIDANSCGEVLGPGDSCTVRVQFVATAAGERVAQLQIQGSNPITAVLSGTGVAPPARIAFTPSSASFGDVEAGGASEIHAFTVTNELVATTLTPSLVGPGASGYQLVSTDCATGTIPLHGTCTVMVKLAPGFGGEFLADLVLTDATNMAWRAGLAGSSNTPLSIGPYIGYFSSMLVGQTEPGEQVTFTVTNGGTTTTGALTATTVGPAATDFTIRSTTCTTLAPGATCTVVVELTAMSGGAKHAQLAVSDPATAVRAGLRGDGYAVLVVGAASFPATTSGQQSAVQMYTVLNASAHATGPIAAVLAGANPSQFTIASTTCAAGLAAHTSCAIGVRFIPTTMGAKAASLDVSATPGGSDSFVISGTAN